MKLVKHCDLPQPPIHSKAGKFVSNQTLSDAIGSFFSGSSGNKDKESSPSAKVVSGQSMPYDISIKDGIVIGFMLSLWFYSIYLMFRAWSKMLNFSDDGSARPEKAAFLWKWLMEHVRNKKKEQESTSEMDNSHLGQVSASSPTSFDEQKKFADNSPTSQTGTMAALNCDDVVVVHETSETIKEPDAALIETNTDLKEPNSFYESPTRNKVDQTLLPTGYCPYTSVSSIELQQQQQRPLTGAGTNKKRLQKQTKSLGQYEFKSAALSSDMSQVQERLAVLDKKADIELDSVKSESESGGEYKKSSSMQQSPPPALPPRDYFTNNEEEMV